VNRILITRGFGIVAMTLVMVVAARAESIRGTVVIKKKLTKRRVTAAVPMYERGPSVELGADQEEDPMAFERSRVAIYLDGRFPSQPEIAKTEAPKMEQTNRRFSPETLVIAAGSRVSFPNLDPIFHNVFSLSGAKTFDLGNFPRGDTRTVTFPAPGIVYVNCHLHPNMTASIVVAPNKWNTRADGDGRFELEDVPPGKYTIVAWHKAAGFFRQAVVVEAGRNEQVEFLIPVDENGRKIEATPKLQAQKAQTQKAQTKTLD
jgi:plastocyanin